MKPILEQLNINASVVGTEEDGAMTKYYLTLQPGEKVSKIRNYTTEIALCMKSYSEPIVRVITERGLVCLEMLTKPVNTVKFDEVAIANDKPIPLILGRSHGGSNLTADLSIMPHLLIAGTTGSGKSVMLHSIISGFLATNQNVKLALIDPKRVEFSYYKDIKQLMYPVITNPETGLEVLSDLVDEMEHRFDIMSAKGVNSIDDYNENTGKNLPYIVLIIDEFSDLMTTSKKEFEPVLCRLAQKSRAAGIHIIIATQRPSAKVITGLIKSNLPARISCKVSSNVDSRVVLDEGGAETLLGRGDALIKSIDHDMVRFQGAFISVEEIKALCELNKRSGWSRLINKVRGV